MEFKKVELFDLAVNTIVFNLFDNRVYKIVQEAQDSSFKTELQDCQTGNKQDWQSDIDVLVLVEP